MSLPTQPLRDKHRDMLRAINDLKELAHDIGLAPMDGLRADIEKAYLFLENQLVPHARSEDELLYPVVGQFLGSAEATRPMSHDHREIASMVEELGVISGKLDVQEPSEELKRELRSVLYGLHALIRVHFVKEEELYLPIIDQNMTGEEAATLLAAMESMSHETRLQRI